MKKKIDNIDGKIIALLQIRLDCVSEANHNLNRLLDKPGIAYRKYLLGRYAWIKRGSWRTDGDLT